MRNMEDLKQAKENLLSLLPSDETIAKITANQNLEVACHYQPTSELGGDFYDIFNLDDGRIGIFFWDFAGHGIGAALNTLLLYNIIRDSKNFLDNPGQLMTEVNNKLYNMLPRDKFATMFYGIIDSRNRVMEYSHASCPPPILISFKDKKSHSFDTKSFPLGIQTKCAYTTEKIALGSWDALLLYSDALIETKNANNKFLTVEELMAYVNDTLDHSKITARSMRDIIMAKFELEYAENLVDDLTLKIVKFT